MTNSDCTFDFDTPIDRRGSGSLKWDVPEGELPMWVADMDFKAAPPIQKALADRVAHGVFGYSILPSSFEDAICHWWQERHHFTLRPEWLIFCTGVVPAISTAVRKLTTAAEEVVILTPVYNIFFNSIVNNGRRVVECPLTYRDGHYQLDLAALENALSRPQATLLIFCNPHNPVGKIWSKEDLAAVGELCQKHHVTVISDEIHCDLTDPGKEYIPFASVSQTCRDISVSCIAPTKAFNLAGLQTAAVVIPNEGLRNRIHRALNTDEVAEPNAFAVTATVAAFREGGPWLDALRSYIFENKKTVADFLKENLPMLRLVASEATYLLWIDISQIPMSSKEFCLFVREKSGLYLSEGSQYGKCGEQFLRMNIACPRARVLDGLARLKSAIDQLPNG